ncbi:MAG: signal peptidase I [Candidatus Wildermuthbacteria bacterium]|nr:signal peptidase I [Candidatus Wildermuthbacteria bacterium]
MIRSALKQLWGSFGLYLVALAIVLPLRLFIFQPFLVSGNSMEPNFHTGDYLLIDEISYAFKTPQRGDVIILKYPNNPAQKFIKRVVGLPGETVMVRDGSVYIQQGNIVFQLDESAYLEKGQETPGEVSVALGEKEYFVLGDNRAASLDSRVWGMLSSKDIVGRLLANIVSLRVFAKTVQ